MPAPATASARCAARAGRWRRFLRSACPAAGSARPSPETAGWATSWAAGKNLFGIHSPSKLFKDEIGTNLALGIGEGFTDTMTDVQQEMADAIPTKFDTTINSKIGNNSYQNVANSGSFDNMVIAFKTALKDVKVIMDEKEMGTFVTNAVEEVVYS